MLNDTIIKYNTVTYQIHEATSRYHNIPICTLLRQPFHEHSTSICLFNWLLLLNQQILIELKNFTRIQTKPHMGNKTFVVWIRSDLAAYSNIFENQKLVSRALVKNACQHILKK